MTCVAVVEVALTQQRQRQNLLLLHKSQLLVVLLLNSPQKQHLNLLSVVLLLNSPQKKQHLNLLLVVLLLNSHLKQEHHLLPCWQHKNLLLLLPHSLPLIHQANVKTAMMVQLILGMTIALGMMPIHGVVEIITMTTSDPTRCVVFVVVVDPALDQRRLL